MNEVTETVSGAVDALADLADEFWPVLEADETLKGPELADTRAEITQLMEGATDNIAAIKKILHDLREAE